MAARSWPCTRNSPAARWAARGCATALVQGGPQVTTLRRHLLQRALRLGNWITDNPYLRLRAGRQALDPEIYTARPGMSPCRPAPAACACSRASAGFRRRPA